MADEDLSLPEGLDQPPRAPTAVNLLLAGIAAVALYDWWLGGVVSERGILLPGLVWEDWEGGFDRLLSAAFLHVGVPHLVLSSLLLLLIGAPAERIYGRGRLVLTYLVAALGAGIVSIFLRPEEAAATSSGGVAGIAGLMVGFGTFRAGSLPEEIEARLKLVLAAAILSLTALGFVVPEANDAMHLGGFASGFLLGSVLEPRIPSRRRRWTTWLAPLLPLALGALLLLGRGRADRTLPAVYLRAGELGESGDKREAIALLESALAGGPKGSADRLVLPLAQNMLAWYYVETAANLERGIALSLESNERRPNNALMLDTLGYLYALAGRCSDAAAAMERAVAADARFAARRDEVVRACRSGEKPDTEVPIPEATPTPRPQGQPGTRA